MILKPLSFIEKFLVPLVLPALMYGYASGPPSFVTGDPKSPDGGATCNQSGCHTGTAVNVAGAGSVTINAGSGTYTPGQTIQISVTVADPKQRAWGFELTARILSSNAQAGNLNSTDSSTFVQCADGSFKPTSGCSAAFNTQFIQHATPKTGTGSATFTFSWTAPATNVGTVVLYAAGNAANGDGNNTGDHIYTTSIQLAAGASLTTTTTTLTSSANPSHFGQNFSLTAKVSPASATGTVTFNDGTTSLGTASLSGGTASITISACLTAGTHAITAVYGGDTNNATSSSTVFTETIDQGTTAPVIKTTGVVPIGSTTNTIQSGSWVSVYGCNFGAGGLWDSLALANGFPTSVAGDSVKIDNLPGYLWFVSPTQINVQVPNDTFIGPVQVSVTNSNGTSNSVTATLANIAPSFVLLDATHAVGVIPTPSGSGTYQGGTYDLLGPVGAFSFTTRPAKKGETVELYGVGFGPTQSPAPAGQLISASLITSPISATIGGVSAPVVAAIVAAGEYQINVTIPAGAPSGDQPLVVTVGGTQPTQTVVVTVQ